MRIISGKYKGRILKGFDIDGTRPTMDRVKESIFSMIQNNLEESNCLDLFSGSGSLGLEALSNGAKFCYFSDNNKIVIDILNKNLKDIDNKKIFFNDYKKTLNNLREEKFDVIFLDPPYKLNLINYCIKFIEDNDMLNKGGIIVCEYETENLASNLSLIKEKKYGTTWVRVYKK